MRAGLAILAAVATAGAGAASAQVEDHATCMARAIALFEDEATRIEPPLARTDLAALRPDRVETCGLGAIVLCDLSDDRVPCQRALAGEQAALTEAVLAAAPPPEDLAGRDGHWSDGLYPVLWALGHGSSAGPDCEGSTEMMAAWCDTREESRRLAGAVTLWQLARLLGGAEPALEAGWIGPPPPPRPEPRPAATE
ncbi:hypothetical protein HKCCE2091_08195 [Rhodobacterales bacterium HKCCE2091]|nr:hypothetical protein [Rhodobacterales bacterium HKCCE2091]